MSLKNVGLPTNLYSGLASSDIPPLKEPQLPSFIRKVGILGPLIYNADPIQLGFLSMSYFLHVSRPREGCSVRKLTKIAMVTAGIFLARSLAHSSSITPRPILYV